MPETHNAATGSRWSRIAPFGIALSAVACGVAVRFALRPALGGHAPLVVFAVAVMVAARYGGVVAGLAATALGAPIALLLFIAPYENYEFHPWVDGPPLALFVVAGTGISFLSGRLRRALEETGQSREQLRLLTEGVPQLVWRCDAAGRCDFLNARWAEYTGIPVSQQLGMQWVPQLHPDDVDRTLAAWDAAVRDGHDFRAEYRIRRHDGVYRWFDARAVPLRNAGRVLRWFGANTDVHEAHEARDELRAQRERLEKIVATAPGVICSFRRRPDGSTCFPYASPGIRDLYGVDPQDLVEDSAPVFSLIHPDDAPHVQETIARSAETMQPWRDEFRVRNPGRGEIWVEGHSRPARQPDGSIEWYGFVRDVTERRQTQQKLRDHAVALEELTRTLDLAHVIVRSLDGQISYWSEGAAALYGWTREEALGRRSHDLLRTEFPLPVEEIGDELQRTGRWEGELRHFRRDGSAVAVASHWALHRDGNGAPRSVIEVNNDISGQKRVEQDLRASEERLEMAQAAAGIAAWDWNLVTGETLCSPEYAGLYGLPPGDHAPDGREWLRLVHPEDREAAGAALDRALAGGDPYDIEFRIQRPDGGVRWLLGKAQVYRDSAGAPVRMVGVNFDITERKEAAEQLRALSASLIAAQEEERRRISRELHDDLVQRLAFMAIDLGKLISRNPNLPSRAVEELRAAQERATEAAELTRHIAHELHPWILDDLGIDTALRSLCEEVARREDFTVEYRSRDLPPAVKREVASCVYAVAQEALLNASKHAQARRVEIELSGGDGVVRLAVSDDGVGLPSAADVGVGLGIVNMRERVRWVKGVFSLESAPGRGARITVEIPAGGSREATAHSAG